MMKIILVVVGLIQLQAALGDIHELGQLYDYKALEGKVITSKDFYDVEEKEVTFRLWTRGQTKYEQIFLGKTGNSKFFKAGKPIKFITHGYRSDAESPWVHDIKDGFLTICDCNVVEVDWSGPASSLNYISAAKATKSVGRFIGLLLVELKNAKKISFDDVQLVGHSLGAHVSGFAGKTVQQQTMFIIDRVTGLDPAGPYFRGASKEDRLALTDAYTVDAIHTDGNKYGYLDPIGSIDFYPNGGIAPQPGCTIISEVTACSHLRVHQLFVESITSDAFKSRKCSDFNSYVSRKCLNNELQIMGQKVAPKAEGNFYLTTNKESPFARNDQI